MVAFVGRATCESKCIAAGTRFGQSVRADLVLDQARKVFAFLFAIRPSHDGIVDKGVLHVDEDAERCVHSRNLLNRKNRHEKTACAAAKFFGNVNCHQPEIKQFRNETLFEFCFFVHLSDKRPDPAFRE